MSRYDRARVPRGTADFRNYVGPNGDTTIHPFKGRVLELTKKVRVHRNLRRSGVQYTILQGGLVVGYAGAVTLCDCRFIVYVSRWELSRRERRRNVHAFVEGFIEISGVMGGDASERDLAPMGYDIKRGVFCERLTIHRTPLAGASTVYLNNHGISFAYGDAR